MPKRKDITPYLPQLQSDYQRELLERVMVILQSKGIEVGSEQEMHHLFKERVKKTIHKDVTTLSIDGTEFCAYGPLHASFEGDEIKTNYKFAEI